MCILKRKIILCLIIGGVICSSCNKKNPTPEKGGLPGHAPSPCTPRLTPITDVQLLACKYKPGSYWVFKDSLSGAIDTLVVEKLSRFPYLVSAYSCDTLEYFNVSLRFKKETVNA